MPQTCPQCGGYQGTFAWFGIVPPRMCQCAQIRATGPVHCPCCPHNPTTQTRMVQVPGPGSGTTTPTQTGFDSGSMQLGSGIVKFTGTPAGTLN